MTTVTDTGARLRRLLAILAWLAQAGEAPIDVVAAQFELSPESLVTELELAACCGVPPYSPDQLMEIVVTDTTVSTRVGTSLARPRRLSPSEGFALAASARALLAVPGSDEGGALSRALAKLNEALGGEQISVDLDTPVLLDQVKEALASKRRLLITYYSASTDRETERRITPRRLFASAGHWYVDAWCETAGDVRRFRVDRIGSAELVEGPESVLGNDAPDQGFELFVPGPDSRRVRLSLLPDTAWLVESIPAAGSAEVVDGRVEIELFVGGEAWLERLLLRLGPDARVVEPAEYRTLAATAASRVLKRYEKH